MKKTILLAMAIIGINAAIAQTNTAMPAPGSGNTPPNVTNQFKANYPNASASWTSDGSYYRAEYLDSPSSTWHANVYDKDGNIAYTEYQLGSNSYPAGISNYYTSKYPNESYMVWLSKDVDGNQTYYITRNPDWIYFDKDGNYDKSGKSKRIKKTKTTKE